MRPGSGRNPLAGVDETEEDDQKAHQQRYAEDHVEVGDEIDPASGLVVGPCVADWDGDGRVDLLAGRKRDIVWYRNTGKEGRPEFQNPEILVPANDWSFGDERQDDQPGRYHAICVVDFNADGRLDLLLGDHFVKRIDLTEEQKARIAEALLKRMGHAVTGRPGSWLSGGGVLRNVINERVGEPAHIANLYVADGSGLSRDNRVSAALLTDWLNTFVADKRVGDTFINSLAIGGESGTLRRRFRIDDVGRSVSLAGWVHRRRDLGQLIFLDLRDRYGITQVVIDAAESPEAHRVASEVRPEFVIRVSGTISRRLEGSDNPLLPTGEVELRATTIEVLSAARTPPFVINDPSEEVDEALRLKYRYLDLRREPLQQRIVG